MANSTFGLRPGKSNRAEMNGLGGGRIPWSMSPEVTWVARILATDFDGEHSTQVTTVTIPSAGFVSGRLTLTFSGGPLESPVAVVADASVTDDEELLGDAMTTELTGVIAGGLAGVLASVDNSTASNVLALTFEQGIGQVSVVATWRSAQVVTATFGGTLVDGTYAVDFADLPGTVEVEVARSGGTPATAADMAVAMEAAIEALTGTTLRDIVVSADDSAGVNTIQFEPGYTTDATVTSRVPSSTTITFGGTETDGDYVARFDHPTLPSIGVTITTTRSGGAPATNTDLADAFEGQVEGSPQLAPLIDNADNAAGVNTITTYPGVEDMTVTAVSAPAPGTLVVSNPTLVIADATPAGPTVTVEHALSIDLNSLQPRNAFPANVVRLEAPMVRRIVSWSPAATIQLDDAGAASTDVLTAVAVNGSAGWVGENGTSLGDLDVPEPDWEPRVTLTSATLPTAGEFEVHVRFAPMAA